MMMRWLIFCVVVGTCDGWCTVIRSTVVFVYGVVSVVFSSVCGFSS
jgi:hypothetical protein